MRNLFSRGSTKSTALDAESISYKGWLYKEGEHNKDFKRRFFVLSGQHVAYFAKEEDVPKGASKGEITALASGAGLNNKRRTSCSDAV